jgi:predicted amidophosphoribosyltransferase
MIPGMPETHDWGKGPRLTIQGIRQTMGILGQSKYYRCRKCGKPIERGTEICPKCGENISPGRAVPTDTEPPLFFTSHYASMRS